MFGALFAVVRYERHVPTYTNTLSEQRRVEGITSRPVGTAASIGELCVCPRDLAFSLEVSLLVLGPATLCIRDREEQREPTRPVLGIFKLSYADQIPRRFPASWFLAFVHIWFCDVSTFARRR